MVGVHLPGSGAEQITIFSKSGVAGSTIRVSGRQVVVLARRWRADVVLVEDKGSGTQLIQDLRAEGLVRPIAILPEADKRTRFFTQCARIEAGHVLLPEVAPWLDAFRRELLQFPHGRHDDQVDSVSQYLAHA